MVSRDSSRALRLTNQGDVMSDQTGIKVSEQDVLARQALMFVLAYINEHKNFFGNYDGYRDRSVKRCFFRINHLLPAPLRDLDYLDTTGIFPRNKYTTCAEGYDPTRHGHYEPPFSILPISERSAVQSFVNRFNVEGVAEEMRALQKPIKKWLQREEMLRAEKAITLLKFRTRLSSLGKKYPELKRALEKL